MLRYVPGAPDAAERVERVRSQLAGKLAKHNIAVTGEEVPEIPHDRGKSRFIISDVK